MSRSKWKGPYIQTINNKASRSSEIVPKFLGLVFNVHNGKSYSEITITNEMIGHKFGEFVSTRSKFVYKKKKSKK